MNAIDSIYNDSRPLLLFDGVCNLCNGFVQWVLKRDKEGKVAFCALQSDLGQQIRSHYKLNQDDISTVLYLKDGKLYTHADVSLEIARDMGGVYSLFGIFRIFPRSLRNAIYSWVAKNRYRWFGKQDQCMMPRPEWNSRFL